MANQQLVDYIKAQMVAGVARLDLEKAVIAAGWSQKDATDAFAVAEGRAPATPTPPAPVSAPVAKPVVQAEPVAMRPAAVTMSAMPARRSRTWLWVPLIIAVIVVVGGAAYFFIPQVQTVVGFYLGQTPSSIAIPDNQTPFIPPTVDESTTTPDTTDATTSPEATTSATTTP